MSKNYSRNIKHQYSNPNTTCVPIANEEYNEIIKDIFQNKYESYTPTKEDIESYNKMIEDANSQY